MKLIRFEIKKIIFSKRTIISTIAILIISVVSGILDANYWIKDVENPYLYNEMVAQYEGKINEDLEKKLEKEEENYYIDSKLKPSERRTEIFKQKYIRSIQVAKMWNNREWKGIENPDSKHTIDYLSTECKKLELEEKKNSYIYKDKLKNVQMLKNVGEPGYYNNGGWELAYRYLTFTKGVFLMLMVMLIVVAPVFSEEYSNGMDIIIKSTKMGRGKIVRGKIITSLLFAVGWVTIFYALNTLIRVLPYKNFDVINAPLNSITHYEFTPFKWTIRQGFIASYLMAILSACALTTIFCLISSAQKNSLVSIALGMLFVFAPIVIGDCKGIFKVFMFLPSMTMSTTSLFSEYTSFNIMGKPVLYPVLSIIMLMATCIFSSLFTHKVFYKKVY